MKGWVIGKFVLQLLFLMLLNQVGYWIVDLLGIKLPGNVVGMLLLFVLLWGGVVKLEWVEGMSSLLIKHLGFFFIPICVGLMTLGAVFINQGFSLLTILVASGVVGIGLTGFTSQYLTRKKEGVQPEYHHHSM